MKKGESRPITLDAPIVNVVVAVGSIERFTSLVYGRVYVIPCPEQAEQSSSCQDGCTESHFLSPAMQGCGITSSCKGRSRQNPLKL